MSGTVAGRETAAPVWAVAAPFFLGPESRWLDDLMPGDGVRFRKIPRRRADPNWHMAKGRTTGAGNWIRHVDQALRAHLARPEGIVTSFPHLAMCAGLIKRLGPWKPKILAYNYNLGGLHPGLRQRLARLAAPAIDLFVVHSPAEVESYARYLGQPPERFRFVPLQRRDPEVARDEDTAAPFLLAMGSANRDYATLVAAVEARALPTVIVTRPDIARALPARPHVTVRSGLSRADCFALLARARLSVTPISSTTTASGQITFVDAMQLGVPVIATRCPGTDGYVEDGRTGVLVPPGDAAALGAAIGRLWDDPDARARLSAAARDEARARFSDAAAARRLRALVEELRPAAAGTAEAARRARNA